MPLVPWHILVHPHLHEIHNWQVKQYPVGNLFELGKKIIENKYEWKFSTYYLLNYNSAQIVFNIVKLVYSELGFYAQEERKLLP